MRQKSLVFEAIFFIAVLFSAPLAGAKASYEVCDAAAYKAAVNNSVPFSILQSIARVESGQTRAGRYSPWPWTANVKGAGHFFATKSEVLTFVSSLIDQGIFNIDVGCFQINLRWHAKNFSSLENAFDPTANADYAARFLMQLYNQHGNWEDAVASYHSRTDVYADAYLKKVKSAWEKIKLNQQGNLANAEDGSVEIRVNTYPLLQPNTMNIAPSAPLSPGSIMPLSAPAQQFYVK